MRLLLLCIVFSLLNFVQCDNTVAQNPLRTDLNNNRQLAQDSHNRSEQYYAKSPITQDTFQQQNTEDSYHFESTQSPRTFDPNVEATAFTEIPKNDVATKNHRILVQNQTAGLSSANALTSDTSGLLTDKNKMLELIMKISLNLAFVLSIAVGIILISRKWLGGSSKQYERTRAVGDSLIVRETLKIDSRTLLRLVQWRSNRFLVASDQNGIQSVKTLNLTFDQTLQELDDPNDANEEKIIKKLLAGLSQK